MKMYVWKSIVLITGDRKNRTIQTLEVADEGQVHEGLTGNQAHQGRIVAFSPRVSIYASSLFTAIGERNPRNTLKNVQVANQKYWVPSRPGHWFAAEDEQKERRTYGRERSI